MHEALDEPVDAPRDPSNQNRSETTPLYLNAPDSGALRLIVGFFAGFSITVTIALAIQLYYGHTPVNLHGSVVSDHERCSNYGLSMLRDGGSAVDAVIATAFCMGVIKPNITGIGSGGYMLIYDQRERKLMPVIDFRVTRSNHTLIGIPGFVAGLGLAHELHGILPWDKLISQSEALARYLISEHKTVDLKTDINYEDLATTLHYVATLGPSEFYKKVLARDLAEYVLSKDVLEYRALSAVEAKETFMNYDIMTAGKGSGGPFLLKNLKNLNNSLSPLVSAVLAFESVAKGRPLSYASHIAAVDSNDVYVTMVSGLGSINGSGIIQSGFILNNMIQLTNDTNQRPSVLLTPVIALQSKKICGRRLLTGAGDIRDLIQALSYVLRNESGNIMADIEAPRGRILTPYFVTDNARNLSVADYNILSKTFNISVSDGSFPSINVIEKINDNVFAYADKRGGGDAATF